MYTRLHSKEKFVNEVKIANRMKKNHEIILALHVNSMQSDGSSQSQKEAEGSQREGIEKAAFE